MNIVVLGDCASNGNNCFAHRIIDNPQRITYSLAYHKQYKDIIKWYLKQERYHTVALANLQHTALAAYRLVEKQCSWPSKIDGKVYNYSKVGQTFMGYLVDLRKHIATYGKPDSIIVTDYTENHLYIRTKVANESHEGIVYPTILDTKYNPELHTYSQALFDCRYHKAKVELTKSQNYHNRKSYHAFYWLKKYINELEIPVVYVTFRPNTSISSGFVNALDVSDIHNLYCGNNEYQDGEDSELKLKAQQILSDRINTHLTLSK